MSGWCTVKHKKTDRSGDGYHFLGGPGTLGNRFPCVIHVRKAPLYIREVLPIADISERGSSQTALPRYTYITDWGPTDSAFLFAFLVAQRSRRPPSPLVSFLPASAGRLGAMSSSTRALEGIPQESIPDIARDRAAFDGLLLNAIAYGALLMLCAQLVQSLYLRPKRGRTFYYMIAYAVFVFAVTTIAVSGRFVTAEQQFIDNRMAPEGPTEWFWNNSDSWQSIMTFAGTVAVPWVADLLMMYRIHVLWNRRICFVALPALLYLTGIAISVPFIISMSRPHDETWAALSPRYKLAYVAVMSAFNIVVSITIFVRLFMLRKKVVQVMGKVPAIMYNSPATLFVETATFYTIWITCYLVLICRDSYAQDVFLQGAVYVLAITRIHILERMVTHTAWSKDIVSASAQGVLDWEISSVHSHTIPMHTTRSRDSSAYPASSQEQERIQNLPKKFRDDNMVF